MGKSSTPKVDNPVMATERQTILFENRDGIAYVTLNRPAVGNAINLQMALELKACSGRLRADSSVRTVVLAGAGRHFCAGGDISCPAQDDAGIRAHVLDLTSILHAAIIDFTQMDAPVVAVAEGSIAGAGIALLAAADLAVAGPCAKFRLAYSSLGLTPDGGLSFVLPQLVGRKRAMDLLLTNRTLGALEALEWGLVNQVAAEGAAQSTARQLAARIAQGPLHAFGAIKNLLAAASPGLEEHMALESRTIAEQRLHREGREGVDAFFERREPNFY
jgi:2-(1,2-epoxy-1,2-dihydrophenyl)acetyl-CoA isomerase